MIRPFASVESSDDGSEVIARLVVVAFVAVALVTMMPPLNERSDVVAFEGNGSWRVEPVASVPHERTPAADALTSQLPAERFVMAKDVVVALPKSAVVTVPDAMVVLPFAVRSLEKMFEFVKVLAA